MIARRNLLSRVCTLVHCRLSTVAEDVKPYEAIPTPSNVSLPLLGQMQVVLKKPAGFGQAWKTFLELKKKYVPDDVSMLRLHLPLFNEITGKVVILFDPVDVETVYRHEGKYPNRGNGFHALRIIRSRRPDVFEETTGLLTEEGESWQSIRSKVQQDLMRPKSAMYFVDKLQVVSDDFVKYIKVARSEKDNSLGDDVLPHIYRFALESISLIALDTRIGCLEKEMDSELNKVFNGIAFFVDAFPELLTRIPTWKFFNPRWNKLFRDTEDNFSLALDYTKSRIDDAKKRIEDHNRTKSDDEDPDKNEVSVLEKLILRNGNNSLVPVVMAVDMMFAGIDTTGNTTAFLLYHLATNPEKQEALRRECQQLGEHLTAKDLSKARYLNACLKESLRMTPTIAAFGRMIPEDIVVRGYTIPKDTFVMWSAEIFGRDQTIFDNPEVFRPERWLVDEEGNKPDINPYAVRQFSKGPRMCIGKRFAELEIQLVIHKLMHNFRVEHIGEKLETKQVLVNAPVKPLQLRFVDL